LALTLVITGWVLMVQHLSPAKLQLLRVERF
jgi:hypothetical protein